MQTEERVRFCDSCNAVIGWYASYCEECGLAVAEEDRGDAQGSEDQVTQVQRDLYKAHVRLAHRFHERAAHLNKQVVWLRKAVDREEGRPGSSESEQRLLLLAEKLLDLEEEWEEVQRAYNKGSETIEEEFLERIDELEADLELPPDLQHAVNEEVVGLVRLMEEIEKLINEIGRRIELFRQRARKGGLFGVRVGSGRAWAVVTVFAFLCWAGGGAYALLGSQPPQVLAYVMLASSGLGLCALAAFSRPR